MHTKNKLPTLRKEDEQNTSTMQEISLINVSAYFNEITKILKFQKLDKLKIKCLNINLQFKTKTL